MLADSITLTLAPLYKAKKTNKQAKKNSVYFKHKWWKGNKINIKMWTTSFSTATSNKSRKEKEIFSTQILQNSSIQDWEPEAIPHNLNTNISTSKGKFSWNSFSSLFGKLT